jgi:hypothetical protein
MQTRERRSWHKEKTVTTSIVGLIVRRLLVIGLVLAAIGVPCPQSEAKRVMVRRYKFEFDPATAIKDLLPTPPLKAPILPPYLNEDLTKVPELTIGEPVGRNQNTEKETAHVIAKINHLNQKDPDGFLKALLANRADLRGLPFLMGDDCKSELKQAQLFSEVVTVIHNVHAIDVLKENQPRATPAAEAYWTEMNKVLSYTDIEGNSHRAKATRDDVRGAKVAALMQMFTPASEGHRLALAKQMAVIAHADATRALARLALFTHEESVRAAAIASLKSRDANEYKEILLQGFRYPLPAVAQRAAEALVRLDRKDLVADLVNVLEEPDPRAPAKRTIDGKEETVVRELVRVNHHRNCLLCHAPGNTQDVPRDVLRAPVSLPDRPLATHSGGGYGFGSSPDIFIRTDITYLRQDFSLMMDVDSAHPWPGVQRFDFFVRTRVVTPEEAAECDKQLAKQATPPSHAAAHHALRELTGRRGVAATAQAWRSALNLR